MLFEFLFAICTLYLEVPVTMKKLLEYQGVSGFCYGDLSRARTCDPYPVKVVLSQLSYEIKGMFTRIYYSGLLP
jgi:hypothetical protein